jgi:hypothetical protein
MTWNGEAQQNEFVSIRSNLFVGFAKPVSSRCNENNIPHKSQYDLHWIDLSILGLDCGGQAGASFNEGKVSKVQEMRTAAGRQLCGPYRIWLNNNTRPIVLWSGSSRETLFPSPPACLHRPLNTHRKFKANVTRSSYCSVKWEGTADASVILSEIGTNTLQELFS